MVLGCTGAGSSKLKSISSAGSKLMAVPSASRSCRAAQQAGEPEHSRLVGAGTFSGQCQRTEQGDFQALEAGTLAPVQRRHERRGRLHRAHGMRGRRSDPNLEKVENTDHRGWPAIARSDRYFDFIRGMISRAMVSTWSILYL